MHFKLGSTSIAEMSQHILFVDDEIPIREMLTLYFKRKGFVVTTAGSRAEAVRLAESTPLDVVILDINLGVENGLELLGLFKRQHPRIPVIMFTSLADDPDLLKEAMSRGASAFMGKTEPLDALLGEVQRVLQQQSGVSHG